MNVGDIVKKESIKILITENDRLDTVLTEKGVKNMTVVSSFRNLVNLGWKQIRESGRYRKVSRM